MCKFQHKEKMERGVNNCIRNVVSMKEISNGHGRQSMACGTNVTVHRLSLHCCLNVLLDGDNALISAIHRHKTKQISGVVTDTGLLPYGRRHNQGRNSLRFRDVPLYRIVFPLLLSQSLVQPCSKFFVPSAAAGKEVSDQK